MGRATPSRRVAAAIVVASGVLVASCSAVIGFPDRTLEDGPITNPESGDQPDSFVDGAVQPGIDAGPQKGVLSPTALDFGLVACGGSAPTTKVLTITNSGGAPLTWTAALAETPDFTITGASAGTIAGGGTATVTISTSVPAFTGAGDTAQSVLTVTTNDPDKLTTALPVKRTAGGGTLLVTPLTAAFGETPATIKAQDIPITVKNTGNQPVTVGFAAPTADPNAGFSLSWTGSPAAVVVAPGASVPLLTAKFTPLADLSFTGTSAISVTGTVCGTSPTALTFTGKGTGSSASVQPGSLDFGLVDCGTTAVAKKFKIINTSQTTPFNWTAVVGGNYTLSASSGAVAPMPNAVTPSFTEITVTPVMIPSQSAVTTNLYGDTLTITTNAPTDDPHVIDLLMTARGAILDQSTFNINFGSVLLSSPATSNFTVTNSGNVPATVSYSTMPAVFSMSPQNQVVGAGANYTGTMRFAPAAAQAYVGTSQLTVPATVLCKPLPQVINLNGSGALGAQLNPTSTDFGLVNCGGSAAAAKKVKVTNTSVASFVWSASLAGGTAKYTISPSTGTLPAGASMDITVTPKAIPATSPITPDLYADTLMVTTNPALESPYVASLHMTAQGAILAFAPASLDFGRVDYDNGSTKTKSFNVVNNGNLAASVTLTRGGAQSANWSLSPTSGTTSPGTPLSVNATFNPSFNGDHNATVSVTTGAAKCAPYPAALTMTGEGN